MKHAEKQESMIHTLGKKAGNTKIACMRETRQQI